MWQIRYSNDLIAWGRTTRAKVLAELDIGSGWLRESTVSSITRRYWIWRAVACGSASFRIGAENRFPQHL